MKLLWAIAGLPFDVWTLSYILGHRMSYPSLYNILCPKHQHRDMPQGPKFLLPSLTLETAPGILFVPVPWHSKRLREKAISIAPTKKTLDTTQGLKKFFRSQKDMPGKTKVGTLIFGGFHNQLESSSEEGETTWSSFPLGPSKMNSNCIKLSYLPCNVECLLLSC